MAAARAAIAPFDLFLASIGTCAGIDVLGFLEARGGAAMPTFEVALAQGAEVAVALG